MRPHVGQAGQQVLVLSQFNLGLGVGCSGALRKNIQDQIRAVEDFALGDFTFDVPELRRRQFVIENEDVDFVFFDVFLDLLQFTASHKRAGVRPI